MLWKGRRQSANVEDRRELVMVVLADTDYSASSFAIISACFSTVSVARSCMSGG